MAKTSKGFFDLRSQFVFYASYHNNTANVVIHLFCIWQLVATILVLLQYSPALMPMPAAVTSSSWLLETASLNLAAVMTAIYVTCYLIMDPVAGGLGSLLMLGLYLGSGHLVRANPTLLGLPLWQGVLGLHVLLWIAQFVGHGVFEKRAPALLDSWDQALITAPLFVLLEILFFFGYRPQFYRECMSQVNKNIAEFRRTKSK